MTSTVDGIKAIVVELLVDFGLVNKDTPAVSDLASYFSTDLKYKLDLIPTEVELITE